MKNIDNKKKKYIILKYLINNQNGYYDLSKFFKLYILQKPPWNF